MKTAALRIVIALFLCPAFGLAQNIVSGTITDQATANPIPGVNVVVKNTNSGAVSDFDGKYTLSAANGDVIVFSYIGYSTLEVVYQGQAILNVQMFEDAALLDEVVVVGYGTARKQDLTGAVDLVTSKDFNQGPQLSAGALISGKVPGVVVTGNSGAPGEGQNILIRGLGTLQGSGAASPLIVVDGVPLGGGVGGERNSLNLINPSDIESFTVLKDASATAIYGARAAGGIIMITTKKGKGKEFQYQLSSSVTSNRPLNQVDVMSGDQFRTLISEIGSADDIARLGDQNTDWQGLIYQNAVGTDNNFSATGTASLMPGSVNIDLPLRFSLGNTNFDGILLGDSFNRTTASLNMSPSFLDNTLRVQFNAKGMYTENKFANRGAIGSAIDFDPTQPVFNGSQYQGYTSYVDDFGVQLNLAPINPLALLKFNDDTSEVRRFLGSMKVDYDLPFLEGLTGSVNLAYDGSNSHGRSITSEMMPNTDPTFDGSYYSYTSANTSKLFEGYLTYVKDIAEGQSLNVVAGHSYQSIMYDGGDYDSEEEEDGQDDFRTVDRSKEVLISYFGRLNYNLNNRFLLTASMRADASSKLNPDDQWGFFPALALAYNVVNFGEGNGVFDELKVRIGYGEVGNVASLSGRYDYLTRYEGGNSAAQYQFGDSFYQTYRPEPSNSELRWEVSETANLGLDFSLLDRRLTGSLNVYRKLTRDLIANSSVDPFTNFSNRISKNIGNIENKGVELNLNLGLVSTDDTSLNLNLNGSYNNNEVTQLPYVQEVGGISGGVGNNIQLHTEGEAPFSFYVYEQVYDADNRPIEGLFVDRNGDNTINGDDRYIAGDPFADLQFGINLNFTHKRWDFALISRASVGNEAYDNVASSKAYARRATDREILTNLHTDYFQTGFQEITEFNLLSDHYIQDASFYKIDNITLGYRLGNIFPNVDARVYGSMQNVATFTDYSGLDPEILGGIDNNFYPRPQSFVLGLNLDF